MLTDKFGRIHNYLRVSVTERCNLRCFYCMPPEGVKLSPPSNIMNAEEIYKITKTFVNLGVNKIRFTGGEPLVRKDFAEILIQVGSLGTELAITTNGVLLDQYLSVFRETGLRKVNVSLDTLDPAKFVTVTQRNYFTKVRDGIEALIEEGFETKINVVLIKGVNDNEVLDFIELTRNWPVTIQFIEFMPFNGNRWDLSKCISYSSLLERINLAYGVNNVEKIADGTNDTSKKHQVNGFKGCFGAVATVTNPFCDGCNRLRLTADGRLKNCLFSNNEADLLGTLRTGGDIEELIKINVWDKKNARGGKPEFTIFDYDNSFRDRNMVLIGG